jgi:hypothetical protein
MEDKVMNCLAVVSALVVLGVSSAATADQCQDVLSAAYNRDYSSGSTQASQAIKHMVCSRSGSSANSGTGLKIDVPGYGSLGFDQSTDKREFQAWCRSDSSDTRIDTKFKNAIEKVNGSVIKAWDSCMAQVGPKVSLSYAGNVSQLIASLAYRPDGIGDQRTAVRDILPVNLTCRGLDKLKTIGPRVSFPCTRTDPYAPSSLTVNLVTVNSPPAVVIPAAARLLKPTFDITGDKNLGDGVAHFRQTGNRVRWSYQNPAFTHQMSGAYYNETEFLGYQTRVSKAGCTVLMKIAGSVSASRGFCFNGSIADGSPSTCDLSAGFQENVCHSY